MSELISKLGDLIQQVITILGYPGIVLVMALENVFPPIPSELVMPFAGYMAHEGTFTLFWVIIAGMLGSVVGALVLYYLGAWANEPLIRRAVRRWGRYALIGEADLDVALSYFSRYGEAVIFFGRLIPLVRSLISIPAGMQRMPLPRFLFYTVLGTSIWSAVLSSAGWFLKENYDVVAAYVEQYQAVVVGVIVLVSFGVMYRRFAKPRFSGSR